MARFRAAAAMATLALALGATGCRVANVDEARAARELKPVRPQLVEDRAGTKVLKALLLPVAFLCAGGVPAEPDPSRISLMLNDSHATGGNLVEVELFRQRYGEQIEAILHPERVGERPVKGAGDR